MNIADRLAVTAQRLPDKVALRVPGQDPNLTYADLDTRADRAAAALQGLGLQPGDRVGLGLGNSLHFVEAWYGALRAGLVAVPINTGSTTEEAAHILGDSGARAVVVSEAFHPVLAGLEQGLGGLDEVVVAGASTAPGGAQTWRQLLAASPSTPRPVEVGENALALLQYKAGTTGRPKGAMLSHRNLLANQEQMRQTRLRPLEGDVILCVLPLFHLYALNVGLALPLACGASVLLVERFDPVHTMEQVVAHRVSVIIGAPPMYIAWANVPAIERYDLACVRFAVSTAAPLPRTISLRFNEQLGIPLWEGYGLTEASPVLTFPASDAPPRPGSVGQPIPGVELRVVGDHGRRVPDGDLGEVVVRGPNVFSGYWNAPRATVQAIDSGGWFHTGDIGYLSEGDLFLVDRKSDLIIVSGFNVYPREVEDVLCRHPKIAEAAVVGTPHPYTGETVKAVVVLRPGEEATAEEIVSFCGRWIARFKCPEVVEFVSELPHVPAGRVRRRDLRG
ncbi:MAG: long-chain-fatty-acid--CoA ligase [Egibacteraceae bacterium]